MSGSLNWGIQNKPLKNNLEWLRVKNEMMMKDLKKQKELYSKLLRDFNWMRIKHEQEISKLKAQAKIQIKILQDEIKEIQTQKEKNNPELGKELQCVSEVR